MKTKGVIHMNMNEAIDQLMSLQHRTTVLGSMSSLIVHDASTAAPKGSARIRREMLGVVNEQMYELNCGAETDELLTFLEANTQELTAEQRRMVEKLRRTYDRTCAIPKELFLRFNRLKSDADMVWHEAKNINDFASFAPYIDQLVAAMREIAGHVAPGMDPYDYWLDNCQEGLNQEVCDRFFDQMAEALPPLIKQVKDRQIDTVCLRGHFPADQQKKLTAFLMDTLCIDPRHCSVCETEHPYTTNMTKDCVRLTTHYYEDSFARNLFTVMHEGGHALYNLHVLDDYAYTVLGRLDHAAVHEGQSRFFENYVARTRPFLGAILPKLRELYPSLENVSADELYAALNVCAPGCIRMSADELSYPMHIIVRYRLEKQLFHGELTAKDLPAAWNGLYRELLGVEVPDDTRGVLQDSHWSTGLYGYFPSYALGSAYGAQLLARMRTEIDVDACLASAQLRPIVDWLNEHIWKYGAMMKPNDLLAQAFGGEFDASYYIAYLTDKYTALYDLN